MTGVYETPTIDSGIIRLADNAFIPTDPNNRDWIAYQAWLAAGNTPDPAPTPSPPTTISASAFLARFTQAEQEAVWAACASTPPLGVGLANGLAAGSIDLTSSVTQAWMVALVAAGAITADREAAILTP
jgi:hypothetical protein